MRNNTNTITVKTMAPYFVKFILTGANRSEHLTFMALDGTTGKMKNVFILNSRLGGSSKRKTSYCWKTNSKTCILYMWRGIHSCAPSL